MGRLKPPERAMLFIGTLYTEPEIFNNTLGLLEKFYGDVLLITVPVAWDYSEYYKKEMGTNIVRQFIFFKKLIDSGDIADIKLNTNSIETSFSVNGRRRINLDPGYITLAKVVLATTKNYSHRISLGRSIYAELTLIFRKDIYTPLPYTYRDYAKKQTIDIFMHARTELKAMLIPVLK